LDGHLVLFKLFKLFLSSFSCCSDLSLASGTELLPVSRRLASGRSSAANSDMEDDPTGKSDLESGARSKKIYSAKKPVNFLVRVAGLTTRLNVLMLFRHQQLKALLSLNWRLYYSYHNPLIKVDPRS
jgi:hypothetical protein